MLAQYARRHVNTVRKLYDKSRLHLLISNNCIILAKPHSIDYLASEESHVGLTWYYVGWAYWSALGTQGHNFGLFFGRTRGHRGLMWQGWRAGSEASMHMWGIFFMSTFSDTKADLEMILGGELIALITLQKLRPCSLCAHSDRIPTVHRLFIFVLFISL